MPTILPQPETSTIMMRILPLFLFTAAALGASWTEFRGPTGQGTSKIEKLPLEWSATKNVAWKKAIPGHGWSSPVFDKEKIYLTSAVPLNASSDLALSVLCLSTKDGKIEWNKEVFRQDSAKAPRIHGDNSHASPTIIIEGDRLYVHFGHQGTACLDTTGKIIWTNRELSYAPVHGNGGSPVVVDDLLVFSRDGAAVREVVALNKKTGKVKWQVKRSGKAGRQFSFCTPLVITVDGKKQIVSPGSNIVAGYDPADGKEIWCVRYNGYSVVPRPVHAHGLIYMSTGFDSPILMAIKPDGKGDVTRTHVKWKLNEKAPNTPSVLVVGDELYCVSDRGTASCLDARTGKVHWQKSLPGNGYWSSPVYGAGRIYFQSKNGVGVVIKPGKKFEQLAKNELGEKTYASYALAEGTIYIRTAKHLYRIGN